nr:hypothetical protein [Tanacetum cinerariifolium]
YVVFNESVKYKDTLKDSGAGIDKFLDELQVEVEIQAVKEDINETLTYHEVGSYEDSSKWKAVMEEEMDFLRKNKT